MSISGEVTSAGVVSGTSTTVPTIAAVILIDASTFSVRFASDVPPVLAYTFTLTGKLEAVPS